MAETKKFGFHSTAMEVVEGIDLTGCDVIVTGGGSGIGIETARAMAKTGARVLITGRDIPKAQAVADDIIKTTGNKNVEVDELVLDSLESVDGFVQRYLAKDRPLHILINNAGIMACPLKYTKDGFENQFGTNHVGHFALFIGLLPALKKAAELTGRKSRVVSVASSAHRMGNINYDDINYKNHPYDEFNAYGQSKTANVLFSVELTRRFKDEGIVSNALMPGAIFTNLQNHLSLDEWKKRGFMDENGQFIGITSKTPEEGASTTVWAAVAPELEGKGGLYLEDCNVSELIIPTGHISDYTKNGYFDYALDPENAKKLWEVTEKMIEDARQKKL